MNKLCSVLICLSLLCAIPAWPAEKYLDSPQQEQRAKALFKQVRCVVCAGESIADSKAGLAQDLRRIIRGEIAQGQSDDAILEALTQRYGEQILMTPPLIPATLLLWGMPLILLVLGGIVALAAFRRNSR